MPEKWKAVLGPMADDVDCGNLYNNPLTSFARGFKDIQESVRQYQDNSQLFFKGEITVEELSKRLQKACVDAIPEWLKAMKYRPDALDDVTKDPAQK